MKQRPSSGPYTIWFDFNDHYQKLYHIYSLQSGTICRDIHDLVDARRISALPELIEFVENIFNGLDTNMITITSPAGEDLANVIAKGREALRKSREEEVSGESPY